MKTCTVRSKRHDQYQSDNRETNDNTKPLSTMINIFHDDKYITLCNFGERNMTQLTCATHFDSEDDSFSFKADPKYYSQYKVVGKVCCLIWIPCSCESKY